MGGPSTNSFANQQSSLFPVKYSEDASNFTVDGDTVYSGPGIGLIFYSPWSYPHNMLVIDGLDEFGFLHATRAFPVKSGITVPDYAVLGPDWLWKSDGYVLLFDQL
jgi:hypothetical protein